MSSASTSWNGADRRKTGERRKSRRAKVAVGWRETVAVSVVFSLVSVVIGVAVGGMYERVRTETRITELKVRHAQEQTELVQEHMKELQHLGTQFQRLKAMVNLQPQQP